MENENKRGWGRIIAAVLILLAPVAVFALRLADWQILNGDSFLAQAASGNTTKVSMAAARGEILDSKGNTLVGNKTGWAIAFDRAYMTRGTENETINNLIKLLDARGEGWSDVLPIRLNSAGEYEYLKGDAEEKEIRRMQGKDYAGLNSYATADQCILALAEKYKVEGYGKEETRNIVSVRYNMAKSGFSISMPYPFAPDVSVETIAIMRENSQRVPGASAVVTTARQYGDGGLAPHILGTLGAISESEYKNLKESGYKLNDKLGKSGVEKAFEDMLRGESGEKVVETTSKGGVVNETVTTPPTNGKTVQLTLDSRLQEVLNASLAKNIVAARENGEALSKGPDDMRGQDCRTGGAVVLRASDFGVLAASSYPDYDITQYLTDKTYLEAINENTDKPLINRAFNAMFEPGSSFKPAVALAALQEGILTESTSFRCTGRYTRWQDYQPKCLGVHGLISVKKALEVSCNIFFYETGFQTGIKNIDLYASRLGLGQKTGIEVEETKGSLAGPDTKADFNEKGADIVMTAIGQSTNMFSPLQLATYVATIANDGTRKTPHLLDKVMDYTRGSVLEEYREDPTSQVDVGVSKENFKIVKEGMYNVTNGSHGSGYSTFAGYEPKVAGKTGTAQTIKGVRSNNVVFIGFAPYDKPEIAVAVVLEKGSSSKFASRVARDVFNAYFHGAYVNDKGEIVLPGSESEIISGLLSGLNSIGEAVSGFGPVEENEAR